MAISRENLEEILRKKFPEAVITITDLAGDNNHYSVVISDPVFAGKTRIAQHRIVNDALGKILGNELHALQLTTTYNQS